MSVSNDRGAYADCFELFDQALASERGVQRIFSSQSEARMFQGRACRARQLDRGLNRKLYFDQPEHPLYNRSEYAAITVRVAYDNNRSVWLCRFERVDINNMEVEEIPPSEDESVGRGPTFDLANLLLPSPGPPADRRDDEGSD